MTDYKNVFKSKYKKLEKEINKSFRLIYQLDFSGKKRHIVIDKTVIDRICKTFKKLIANPTQIIILISALVLFTIIYSFAGYYSPVKEGSFIGKAKIKEEQESMLNINAMGGNESKYFDTNNSELKFFFYKIKQGESLYTISKKLGVSMDTLISFNSIENAHTLNQDKRIIVPNIQGIIYSTKKEDTLESIAQKYKVSVEDIKDANDLTDGDVPEGTVLFLPGASLTEAERAKALGYLFFKPIYGRFTSGFGIRRDPFTGDPGYHTGIDISAPYGSLVKASKEGRVVFAGWQGGYGKCVVIKHLFGFETVYGHLSRILVSNGSWVKQGELIGRVGSTGRSTGPHLHFEVRKFGRPTNPLRLTGLGKRSRYWY